MDEDSRAAAGGTALFADEAWFDPIEAGIRGRIRGFIEELLEQELTAALGRARHERAAGGVVLEWHVGDRTGSAATGPPAPVPRGSLHLASRRGSGRTRDCSLK